MSSSYFFLRDPATNKGLVLSEQKRHEQGLRGLLPAAVLDLETELARVMQQLRSKSSSLEKYLFLQSLQDTNEALYYTVLTRYTDECMPLVYTPTVGQACIEWSHIYRQTPRGIYLSLKDKGHVREALANWPHRNIKAIVFTDGERILGLGDLGANGMGIPVGKLALYTTCAGIHPNSCLPICIDAGTNTQSILDDPFYVGLRQKRVSNHEYDELIEEFIESAKELYGENVLLQFEDFGNTNAFRLLRHFENRCCTFNDDIQGTASVIVAGLIASVGLTGKSLADHKFLFHGAGEAGVGIADLISLAISQETGITVEEARKNIFLVDSQGLVVQSRLASLQHHKLAYAHDAPECNDLLSAVHLIRPTALIGVSAQPKSFTRQVCEEMAANNEQPIIFALSNPTSKSECSAEEAYTWTEGRCIFASGSPFDPVTFNDRVIVPGQGNNAYIFPGVGLGVIAAAARRITDDDMLVAAKELAIQVTPDRLAVGCVYPPLSQIRQVSLRIAVAVANNIHARGDSTLNSWPENIEEYCASLVYNPENEF